MKHVASLFVLTSALLLAACGHYSDELSSLDKGMKSQPATVYAQGAAPQDIAPAAGGIEAGSMPQYLARDYYELARYENDKAYDYKAAKNYTQKAMMASKGQMPMPARISDYDIPSDKIGALQSARAELVEAMKTQNTPENQQALAKAQSSFDCWVEREEEAADDAHAASCRSEFEQSMAMLVTPAAGNALAPTVYEIGFAANSAVIDEASQKTLAYVAQFLSQPENAPYTVNLTGFSEGQGEFASQLMTSRVMAVRDNLIAKQVSPERLKPMVASQAVPAEAARKVQVVLVSPQPELVPNASTTTYVPVTPTKVDPSQIPAGAVVVPVQ